ncbi:MAG: helix-turn-helix transcriptional regulator [Planctomycetes bacterium]|nr:helix-turn-helix transcriptional regulator [Planctomycetota bacterium]
MDRLHGVPRRRLKLSEQIRRAIKTCGQSCYAIAKATGIDKATLSRFMSGERGLPMKTLDVLADYLDLNITTPKRKDF